MVKFNILKIYKKDNTYGMFSFDNFDDVINRIINDNELQELELQKYNIRNELTNAILNKGFCAIYINDFIYEIEAEINGRENLIKTHVFK